MFGRQEQASWVCECDDMVVHQLETEVKRIFQHHYGLEQWAGWLDEITTHLLQVSSAVYIHYIGLGG